MEKKYTPQPLDTSGVIIPESLTEITEALAENVHDVWSQGRINNGWTYGENRDDVNRKHPCLVAYDDLPDDEKAFDRNTSQETIRFILKSGYTITKNEHLDQNTNDNTEINEDMEVNTDSQNLYEQKLKALNQTEQDIIASMENFDNKAVTKKLWWKCIPGIILSLVAVAVIGYSIYGLIARTDLEAMVLLFIIIMVMTAILFFVFKMCHNASKEDREYKQQLYTASFRCLDKLQEKKMKLLEEQERFLEQVK